jgi:hypothetical protein
LLALTVGGDTGFFEPLTRGIGAAARAGASASEIDGFLSPRCWRSGRTPGRRRQYGAAWVRRSLRSFRRRDDVARAAALDSFSKEP